MTQKYSEEFIDKHRDINVSWHDWWDSVYEDFYNICTILGIELDRREPSFSGFWSQGDGASWAGTYRANGLSLNTPSGYVSIYDQAPAAMREHFGDEELHRIADELCLLARIYGPVYARVGRSSHYYVHEMTMQIDNWEPYYEENEDPPEEIAEHIENTLQELFRDLARWLYNSLEREYDYLTSDEAVIETLEANEIEEDEEV